MADAESAFVDALPELPYDNACWDREDFFLDAELLAADRHPWPFVHVGDDDRESPDAFDAAWDAAWDALEDLPLPEPADLREPEAWPTPISGGAPESEPYEPTPSDLAELARWAADLEAGRDAMDFPRVKDLEDRRAFQADIARWYRDNPNA
jgi:hypothetical protein